MNRIPPHNTNAEKSVLGAFLISNKCVQNYLHELKTDDFYLLAHQQIFDAMKELTDNNKNVDIVTVSETLEKEAQCENTGGYNYLAELSNDAYPSQCKGHIEIVNQKSKLRQLIYVFGESSDKAYEETAPESIIEEMEQFLYGLNGTQSKGMKSFADVSNRCIKLSQEALDGKITGYKTHFPSIDH